MSASHALKRGIWGTALLCLVTAVSEGQQFPRQDQPDQSLTDRQRTGQFDGQTDRRQDGNQQVETYLANCLLAKNKAEIEISQVAQKEAENRQVKQFAVKMVQEHQQLAQKLQQVAGTQMSGQRGQSTLEQRQGADQLRETNQRTTQPAQQNDLRAGQDGAFGQLAQIDRQITQKATEAAIDRIRDKSGTEFDQAYLACQVAAHMHMKVALDVISQQTSGELAQIAQQAQPKIEQHLEEAEKLFKQAEQSARQANRPTDREQR
jgi:predicted outer membrane protein